MVVAFGIPTCLAKSINLKKLTKKQPVSQQETAPQITAILKSIWTIWDGAPPPARKESQNKSYHPLQNYPWPLDCRQNWPDPNKLSSQPILLRSEKDVHLHSFFPSTILLWNSLPLITKNSLSLSCFKRGSQSKYFYINVLNNEVAI